MSVTKRIYLIVGLVVLTGVSIASVGTWKMMQVGDELTEIAREDVPLMEKVAAITVHQLEQAILLERAMRGAQISAGTDFDHDRQAFLMLAKKVDAEIEEGLEQARHALDYAKSDAARQKFGDILARLEAIATQHRRYDDMAAEVMTAAAGGDAAAIGDRAVVLEKEQKDLDSRLAGMLFELGKFTEQSALTALEDETSGIRLMLAIAVLGIGLGVVVGTLIGRSVARPLTQMMSVMERMTGGERGIDVPAQSRRDEVGGMARALEQFQKQLVEGERLAEVQRLEERRKLEQAQSRDRAIQSFSATINGIVSDLSDGVSQLTSASGTMTIVAEQSGTRATTVAAAAEQSSVSIQAVAAAMEQMSAAIKEIAAQTEQSSGAVQQANDKVDRSSAEIEKLSVATDDISQVVSLIEEIAEKTNLLALNATIESARAGEAGKGFAVVAQEVKGLANQTQQATVTITTQIGNLQSGARIAVEAVREIGAAMARLNDVTASIAAAIEEQNQVTNEIAQNIDQVASGTRDVSENIVEVTTYVGETGAAAGQVSSTADRLSGNAGVLRKEVDGFFEQLRVA
ncbi:MAG: methyl-accepting chemotaxis protein [Minwuia sp.]|uniref:methyl-accepting chemotaxis protein n=1 Tax=Minwuia sp. TaxID=2493630 RepID=UPI003A87711B